MKQFRLLHFEAYSDEERKSYIPIINQNILESIHILLRESEKRNLQPLPQNINLIRIIQEIDPYQCPQIDEYLAKTIIEVWNDPMIREMWKMRSEFQIVQSASYFINRLETIMNPNYIPPNEDILKSRTKTNGIIEITFTIEKVNFLVVDVAGQRSERRKWLNCFENMVAMLFVVAISEYDQVLAEDGKTNRLLESMDLFEELCNSKWFGKVDVVLFLNKDDLFRKKIQKIDMQKCFPDYEGGKDYDNGIEYLKTAFKSLNHTDKDIYMHETVATETNRVSIIFDAVTSIILNKILKGMDL